MRKFSIKKPSMRAFFSEFREFAVRGNVIDLAVGVIIGGAFSKIVSSLVADIIMPIIGLILGGLDIKNLSLGVGKAQIRYGMFIQTIIDFTIIAFCIFLMVKGINKLKKLEKKKEEKKEGQKEKTAEDVLLLREIRDLLKKR
jgi:large conductance mechanosensitive channel